MNIEQTKVSAAGRWPRLSCPEARHTEIAWIPLVSKTGVSCCLKPRLAQLDGTLNKFNSSNQGHELLCSLLYSDSGRVSQHMSTPASRQDPYRLCCVHRGGLTTPPRITRGGTDSLQHRTPKHHLIGKTGHELRPLFGCLASQKTTLFQGHFRRIAHVAVLACRWTTAVVHILIHFILVHPFCGNPQNILPSNSRGNTWCCFSIARVRTWQTILWAALLTASCDPFPAFAFFASLRARAVADF